MSLTYPVFGVEKHQIHDGDGTCAGATFITFACSAWCNVIARTDAREIVMIWQYRFGSNELSLEIPGGVIDDGEEPIARRASVSSGKRPDTARTRFEFMSTVNPNPALQDNPCHTFIADGARPEGRNVSSTTSKNASSSSFRKHAIGRASSIDECEITHALVVCSARDVPAPLRRVS